MNSTNRIANRTLILIVGVVLLAAGAAVAGAMLLPVVHGIWTDAAAATQSRVESWLDQTPLWTTGVSWIMPAILVVIVLALLVLIVFVVRQGRGRTRTLVEDSRAGEGTVVLDAAVVEHAVQEAVSARPEFISCHTSTYLVRRTPTLTISVTCRRGISPADATEIVEGTLRSLDALLGRSVPALIQVGGGFRARSARATRLN